MDVELPPSTSTPTTNVFPAPINAGSLVTSVDLTTSFVCTGIFTVGSTTIVSNDQTIVVPITSTGTRTITVATIPSSIVTSTQAVSSKPRVGGIIGGVTGATGIIILGLVIFFVLRHKRRHKASRSTSVPSVSVSPNVPGQCMPQSTQLPTTPRPFLDFPGMQSYSSTKGTITDRARTLSVQNSLGDIGPANPFRDPVTTEGNLSDNEGEGQRVRNALDDLRALTSRFERELQQLGALAQSGQLSAEDRLKLEEIRRTTGLTIQFDPRRDRFSIVRSTSSSASSPSFAPPSYHTRSD